MGWAGECVRAFVRVGGLGLQAVMLETAFEPVNSIGKHQYSM